jgi:hypothetical protein
MLFNNIVYDTIILLLYMWTFANTYGEPGLFLKLGVTDVETYICALFSTTICAIFKTISVGQNY